MKSEGGPWTHLLGFLAAFDVIEGDVDVLRRDLVGAAAHSQEGNVEDLRQRDDDGDDDQHGRHLVTKIRYESKNEFDWDRLFASYAMKPY